MPKTWEMLRSLEWGVNLLGRSSKVYRAENPSGLSKVYY
jgi:hypothetical protein